MTVTCLAAAIVAATLLIRRNTWRIPSEVGATLSVLLLGVGAWLTGSQCQLGELLWRLTGYAYLDILAGQLLSLGGLVALLYHILYRLAEHDEITDTFNALVQWPITLIAPLMVSSMIMLTTQRIEPSAPLALDSEGTIWLLAYRAVWCGALVYLSALLIRLLRIVRDTGDPRQIATRLHLAAAWTCVGGAAVRLATFWDLFTPLRGLLAALPSIVVVLVGTAAAGSWLHKMRGYRPLLRATHTTRIQRQHAQLTPHCMSACEHETAEQPPALPSGAVAMSSAINRRWWPRVAAGRTDRRQRRARSTSPLDLPASPHQPAGRPARRRRRRRHLH